MRAAAAARAAQRGQEPASVARRAQQVGRLGEAPQLLRRDQGHILRASPMDDHGVAALGDLIAERGESRPGVCIGDFGSHRITCTQILYNGEAVSRA